MTGADEIVSQPLVATKEPKPQPATKAPTIPKPAQTAKPLDFNKIITVVLALLVVGGVMWAFYPTPTPALSITSNLTTVTGGISTNWTFTSVTFTVTSAGAPVSGATVTLTGDPISTAVEPWAPYGSTTNANGQVIISVPAASAGTITATASKSGYNSGSTTITATGKEVRILLESQRGFNLIIETIGIGDEIVWRNGGKVTVTLVSNEALFDDQILAFDKEYR